MTKVSGGLFQIERTENFANGFCADERGEAVFAILILRTEIIVFREQLTLFKRGQTRLNHDVVFEIKNALKILQRHIEQKADTRWKRLQEPDMSYGSGQFDMAHALAPNARQRHFNAALLADDALVLHALILAAEAFVILDRSKDTRAEKAVTLWLERAVIDRFWLFDFAKRPSKDLIRRSDRYLDMIEGLRLDHGVEEIHHLLIHRRLLQFWALARFAPINPHYIQTIRSLMRRDGKGTGA